MGKKFIRYVVYTTESTDAKVQEIQRRAAVVSRRSDVIREALEKGLDQILAQDVDIPNIVA